MLERMTRQAVSLLSGTGDLPAHSLQAILAACGRLRFHPGDAALASFTLGIARSLPRFQPGGWPLAQGRLAHRLRICARCGLIWSDFLDAELLQRPGGNTRGGRNGEYNIRSLEISFQLGSTVALGEWENVGVVTNCAVCACDLPTMLLMQGTWPTR